MFRMRHGKKADAATLTPTRHRYGAAATFPAVLIEPKNLPPKSKILVKPSREAIFIHT